MEYIKIAWRNIWRNRKRSIITMSSIFFAVFLAIIMRSFQLGSYDGMINTIVEKYSGHIQIENPDNPEDPSIDNCIEYSDEIINKISKLKNVKIVAPKLSSFSYAYFSQQGSFSLTVGINPEIENKMSGLKSQIAKYYLSEEVVSKLCSQNISKKIKTALKENKNKYFSNKKQLSYNLGLESVDLKHKYLPMIEKATVIGGKYLTKNDDGVLIGSSLANHMNIKVGDTLTLTGLGYHGTSAAGLFPVRGIVKAPNPKLDAMIIYTSLKNAEEYFSTYEQTETDTSFFITSYAVNLFNKDDKSISKTKNKIINLLDNKKFLVRDWKSANKTLANQIKSDNESGKMMIALLYIVIAFGIFGTILMMIAERKREMGVMVAVGMKKTKLAIIISIEMFFISLIGLFFGMLVSAPIVALGNIYPIQLKGEMAEMMANYGMEPVMPMAWFDMYYLNQVFIVTIIVAVVMIYPIFIIKRLNIIEALRA